MTQTSNRRNSVTKCECSRSGLCSRRGIEVSATEQSLCSRVGCDIVDRIVASRRKEAAAPEAAAEAEAEAPAAEDTTETPEAVADAAAESNDAAPAEAEGDTKES
jgi:hypothetical protein